MTTTALELGTPTAADPAADLETAQVPPELTDFLASYRPKGLAEEVWAGFAPAAAALVLQAGALTRLRVEKDIQFLGAMVAHLVERGRPVTVEEALSDRALLSFDAALKASNSTRENKRGIARRLQAVHRGLPWRTERRDDGARVDALKGADQLVDLRRVLAAAEEGPAGDRQAQAFSQAVGTIRARRLAGSKTPALTAPVRTAAREFAAAHGWAMTQPLLEALVTHEVLDREEPVAVLVARYGLTRRDLDLALTTVRDLPEVPQAAHQGLLRG